MIPITLYNTLSGKKEPFEPLEPETVRMYNCGPTVYNIQHIGNMRPYIFADVLRRVLQYHGYEVEQVINITDVGHLVSDADEGEDKMERRARESGMSAQEIATEVTEQFYKDLDSLNVDRSEILFVKATDHIAEQIALVERLEEKGFTYRTSDGVYFDTAKFADYGKLGNIDIKGLREGARVEENPEKRTPTDFAIWKLSPAGEQRQQEWDSPWGVGFPGWHIECSAMAIKYLGETFDIHTGGIDHIPVHHNNEIAQSEAATDKQFARYWLHNAFITIEGEKIAKSVGNVVYISDFEARQITALAYRYWLLTGHYRTPMNFTWEALEGAQTALERLAKAVHALGDHVGERHPAYLERFESRIFDDLDTPQALAIVWELVRDESVPVQDKLATIRLMDCALGLGLRDPNTVATLSGAEAALELKDLPEEVRLLVIAREEMREEKNWQRADELRDEIAQFGYEIKDSASGPIITKTQ
jgi:cysteinyl-tRNA synthetase